MVARRYEFYVRLAESIWFSTAIVFFFTTSCTFNCGISYEEFPLTNLKSSRFPLSCSRSLVFWKTHSFSSPS